MMGAGARGKARRGMGMQGRVRDARQMLQVCIGVGLGLAAPRVCVCVAAVAAHHRRTVSLLSAERSDVESIGGSGLVGLAGWLWLPPPGSGMLPYRRGDGPLPGEPTEERELRRLSKAPTALGEPRAPPKAECTSCSGGGRRCCCPDGWSSQSMLATVVGAELTPLWTELRGSLLAKDCSAQLLL